MALEAIGKDLRNLLCAYTNCDDKTAKRLLDIFVESFVTGAAADEAFDSYVTNAIVFRESRKDDETVRERGHA